jgi:peptidoglycan/xylan/chitin deacetylase (PgdA/CDA1 family)
MLAAVVWGGVLAAALVTETAHAADHAVVVMYHRFGEDAYSATNIEIEQFESHLAELRSGRYHVMPLEEIVAALKNGTPLPDRAVAITIDDAFTSVYREAWPRLKAEGLPFTLFIATDPLDRGSPDYMTWDQVRELAADGVTIGSQTASHPHMPDLSPAAMREELRRSNERFEVALGKKPALFAYPYGAFGRDVPRPRHVHAATVRLQ